MQGQIDPDYLKNFWETRFPGQIPQPLVVPEALDSDEFELEGQKLVVIDDGFTDTDKYNSTQIAPIQVPFGVLQRLPKQNEELIEHWILGPWDLAQVGNKTGATRLGFAVLLKFFQREGRFPFFKNEVAGVVISFVATQVDIASELYTALPKGS
jgi:hypothetical protein